MLEVSSPPCKSLHTPLWHHVVLGEVVLEASLPSSLCLAKFSMDVQQAQKTEAIQNILHTSYVPHHFHLRTYLRILRLHKSCPACGCLLQEAIQDCSGMANILAHTVHETGRIFIQCYTRMLSILHHSTSPSYTIHSALAHANVISGCTILST